MGERIPEFIPVCIRYLGKQQVGQRMDVVDVDSSPFVDNRQGVCLVRYEEILSSIRGVPPITL